MAREFAAKQRSAFSIIELSIVMLIISILVSGGLVASKSAVNGAKVKLTKDRIDLIYKSIAVFTAVNKRLPCPARLDLGKTDASYGSEYSTSGDCLSFINSTGSGATNLSYGAVPIRALGLPVDMAEDGFGNKFDYVIDKRFAKKSPDTDPVVGFEYVQSVANLGSGSLSIIRVQGPSGVDLMTNSILILISHGSSSFKAWSASGISQNTASSTVADENSNSRDEGSNNYDNTFIAFSSNPNFDDLVIFKSKQQLVIDAGMEFMKCSKLDGNIQFSVTTPSQGYGSCTTGTTTGVQTVNYGSSSTVTCPGSSPCSGTLTRLCGRYGVWGSFSTNCQ